MLTLALTGGIGCGKSTVGRILQQRGFGVCESDVLAHQAMVPGRRAHAEIRARFGEHVLSADGGVDRQRLGDLVFRDPGARAALNAIVHPHVREAWRAWLREQDAAGVGMVAVIIPLLFEVGLSQGWDAIVCVTAPESLQRSRLAARGLDAAAVQRRLDAQWPVAEKARRSDYVIVNDGDEGQLERRTMDVVNQILESKHGRTR